MTILIVGDSYSNANLFYKTRFLAGDAFIYLEAEDRSTLITSAMERGRAQKESVVSDVRSFDDYGFQELLKQLNDRGRALIGVLQRVVEAAEVDRVSVDGSFPALYADSLRAGGIAVQVESALLIAQRRQKTHEEIEAIRAALRAAERAAGHAIELIARSEEHRGILHVEGIPLTSERLRAEIEIALIRYQMDASRGMVVAGGPGAADPHWEGMGPLSAGEPIVLDVFPRGKSTRYFADIKRTVVKGEPGDPLRAMYEAVSRAHEAALARIRAGANGRDVHTAVQEVFQQAGYAGEGPGARFIHGTGHGVGLDIHEAPSLGTVDVELREHDVVTVEPGLYDPAVGAIRIEDLVVVTGDGYENLTTFPKRFEV